MQLTHTNTAVALYILTSGVDATPFAKFPLFRRQNVTAAASPEQLTTSTALVTAIHTITSCAPEVTDCPASAANATAASNGTPGVLTVTQTIFPNSTSSVDSQGAAASVASILPSFVTTGSSSDLPTALPSVPPANVSSFVPPASGVPSGEPTGPGAFGLPTASLPAPLPEATLNGSSGAQNAGLPPSGSINTSAPLPTGSGGLVPLPSAVNGSSEAQNAGLPPSGSVNTSAPLPTGSGGLIPLPSAVNGSSGAQNAGLPPFSNGSSPAVPSAAAVPNNGSTTIPQTTLTVVATQVNTVISCAPTVSSCPAATDTLAISALPADAVQTVLVTDTIAAYTTICPVSEAGNMSSSLLTSISAALTTVSASGTTSVFLPSPTGSLPSPGGPVVTGVPALITTTVSGTPITTTAAESALSSNSPEQEGAPSANGLGSGSNATALVNSLITQTAANGSVLTYTTFLPVATSQTAATTSVLVTPIQTIVTVYVSGSPSLSSSSALLTSTLTVPASASEASVVTVDAQGGNAVASPSEVVVPTQSVVTVTVAGQESLSTSSSMATRTVYVTQAGGGAQCSASTVTVCATGGVCPTGSIDAARPGRFQPF